MALADPGVAEADGEGADDVFFRFLRGDVVVLSLLVPQEMGVFRRYGVSGRYHEEESLLYVE